MKVWEGKQVVGFLLTWRLLRPQLQQQTTDKYIISSCYIGTQSDLTQVTTLKKKIWSSASELKWTKIEQFWMWIVNSDRQFYGTVYVISWTVALILSSRKIVNLEHLFVSFQDFVGKTRNFSVWSLARFRKEGYT